MQNKILDKKSLKGFIEQQIKVRSVIAPVCDEKQSLYKPLEKPEDLCLDYLRPARSAKEIFFPQNEVLFYFNKKSQKIVNEPEKDVDTLLFGVTPCDLAGIAAQDKLFTEGQYVDVYYVKKRKKTIIAAMGCPEPGETCFCHWFDIDRFGSDLADLFFIPLDDKYVIQVNSERGGKLVSELPEATEDDMKAVEELKSAKVEFTTEPVNLEELAEILPEHFDDDLWDDIARRCIGCGTCTFICPTCHCFDITDETSGDLGRRVRTWDGCMFQKFTLHASGHNPRESQGQRTRQRVLHKFAIFPDNQGCVSCTGCGRCIMACPVGMDIRETLRILSESLEKVGK